ncbi:YppE family protein [Fervidibacillus halotolerans]|uniref:YppE family protein n=1 Tax=Fervidibacillus halotolerans TaxID=2980027 RepID=A0A9E8RZA9_9BACI|nr:YppE family protein [Fervidibacillus halotolerans]WAA13726.1 YppE family protein [Fervidibacillus halotolerans]
MLDPKLLMAETEQIKQYLKRIDTIFEHTKQEQKSPNFYDEVKPFFEEVEERVNRWFERAKGWVELNRPKDLYSFQLEAVKDQLLEISVWAFYPETSYKRFKHYVNSIHYTLEKLLSALA